jgi:hypothetical protein
MSPSTTWKRGLAVENDGVVVCLRAAEKAVSDSDGSQCAEFHLLSRWIAMVGIITHYDPMADAMRGLALVVALLSLPGLDADYSPWPGREPAPI